MLIELNKICKSFGIEKILSDITLTINDGDRIGLLGENGAGKSTLLNIITGDLAYDGGSLYVQKGIEIGYLKQNGALNLENTISEEIKSVFFDVYAIGEKLDKIRTKMAGGDNSKDTITEYDRLNLLFEAKDGYNLDVKINTVLNGMGFSGYDRNMSVSLLSGGEKNRLGFAKLLLKNPKVLILDEPTNHLDFEALSWLEEYLEDYKGAILVVSHDRYFLDKVAHDTCEIEDCKLTRYKGGYSKFIVQKEEREAVLIKEYEKQQEEISKLKDFVAKNLAKSASVNGVGTRVKALAKMEEIEKPCPVRKKVSLKFCCDAEPHKDVLRCNKLSVFVGEGEQKKQLINDISFNIEKGEKIAIIGLNGAGKTSFIKAVLEKIPYLGFVRWGENTKVSYFEQENGQLNREKSVIDEIHDKFPGKTELEIRSLLGSLLISGEDVFKKIKDLSGGERAKVAFALLMLERGNVLILDEPTNHLDYNAKEVLDKALTDYTGTLIVVSHDRYLLNRVPTKIVEITRDEFKCYDGGYDYYFEKSKRAAKKDIVKETLNNIEIRGKNGYNKGRQERAEKAKIRLRVKILESEIEGLEVEKKQIEEEMVKQEIISDYKKLQEFCDRIKEIEEVLERDYEEWENIADFE